MNLSKDPIARLLRFLNGLDKLPWKESDHPRSHGKFVRKGTSRESTGEQTNEPNGLSAAQPRKRRENNFPRLSKQEAGKVTSEINTLYHAVFKGRLKCRITTNPDKHSPAYDYYFYNYGFDNYAFYMKRRNRK